MSMGIGKWTLILPCPSEECHHAMHMDDSIVPKITITGGILGCRWRFGLLIAIAMIWYPHNVGGSLCIAGIRLSRSLSS